MGYSINLDVEAKECSYWNYEDQARTHDCGSCHCASEGNSYDNAKLGIMVNGNRYCMLEADVHANFVKKLEEQS